MLDSLKRMFKNHKPAQIEIFSRHCHYSSVSAHKNRFPNFSREGCLANLLETIQSDPRVNITFFLDTAHPMEGEHYLRRQSQYPILECKAGSEAGSFLYMLEYVYSRKWASDTILYFLEDDYLHRPNWTQALREAFTLAGIDYVTLFDHRDKYFLPQYADLKSKIFHTTSCHWRTTPSTTNTYAMRHETLKKHIDIHRSYSLGRTITEDHDKFCKLSETGAVLISSLPGYSTHVETEYASPCTPWDTWSLSAKL